MAKDERVLFDDDAARFSAMPYRRAAYVTLFYAKAFVRVTNLRIIVAQPALFRPAQRVVRYVAYLQSVPADAPAVYDCGYVSFAVGEAVPDDGALKLMASSPGVGLPSFVALKSPRLEEYRKLFQ